MDTLVDIMRCPACDILEESDATDPAIIAQVEPMLHAARDIDHIATFDRDAKDRATFWVKMKDPFALDSKADFVF